ncbi:MAG: hypothetical protein PHT58_05915 [Eubacteriales bacterium]|nr:hypothetical protein [Eubacteriales bacterium]
METNEQISEFDGSLHVFDEDCEQPTTSVMKPSGNLTLILAVIILATLIMDFCNVVVVGTCLVGTIRRLVVGLWSCLFGAAMITRLICTFFYLKKRRVYLEHSNLMWQRMRQPFAYVITLIFDIFFLVLVAFLFYSITRSTAFHASSQRLLFCILTTIAQIATGIGVHSFAFSS